MPEIQPAKSDQPDEIKPAVETKPVAPAPQPRGKSVLKILLEVVLVSLGVFLGLMGQQWNENAQHRELAKASLRQFRTEILENRKAVMAVTSYHTTLGGNLRTYMNSDQPKNPETLNKSNVRMQGIGLVFYDQTAWDLSLATQSLAYVDTDVALALSRVYNVHRSVDRSQSAIIQSTIYGRSPVDDFDQYWRSLGNYFGDLAYTEPLLLKAYDAALAKIDKALAE